MAKSIFVDEKVHVFRLIHMTYYDARDVLHTIFKWGTSDRDGKDPLDEFLTKKLGYSSTKVKNVFNNDQRAVISKDLSGHTFDTTLLVTAILMGCQGLRTPFPYVPTELEETFKDLINEIRGFRNSVAHMHPLTIKDQVFIEKTEQLRGFLKSSLEVSAERYGIDKVMLEKEIKNMNDSINKSRDDSIENIDIESYKNSIYLQGRQKILLTEGKEQLFNKYKDFDHISPVLFFTNRNLHLQIGLVFTDLEIVESRSSDFREIIEYQDLLEFAQKRTIDKGSRTDVLFIEGIAGAGKTTLTRIMTYEWRNQTSDMQHLLEYDLLIYFECRNSVTHSFKQLLETLMSDVLPKFNEGDLMKCIPTLKLLIIADGLDELNKSSTRVFREILELGSLADITIVCTSRPEYVKKFYSLLPEGQCVTHVKIKGIPREKRNGFVMRYHEELRRLGLTGKETEGLIAFMEKSSRHLEEPLRLPLNLAWLTIMWSLSPERLDKVTGATELYTEILGLNKDKLLKKFNISQATSGEQNLSENLDRFILHLSWEALISLKEEALDSLSQESVDRLKNACESLQLNHEPVLSAFLIETIMYDTARPKSVFSVSHKGEMDYLAANYIIEALSGNDLQFDISSIIRSIHIHPSYQNLSLRTKFIKHILEYLESSLNTPAKEKVVDKSEVNKDPNSNKSLSKLTSIKGIFEGLYGINKVPADLSRYQNMFLYTAGLLHKVPNSIKREVADELVSLFSQAGMPDKDRWYNLLEETQLKDDLAESIASKVPGMGKGTVSITDTQGQKFYSKLVQHASYNAIKICLSDKADNNQDLNNLITNLTEKQNCPLDIYLHYHFRNAGTTSSGLDIKLKTLFERGQVRKFLGRLGEETLRSMPGTLTSLWLQIDANNTVSTIQLLSYLKQQGKELDCLGVHLTPRVDPSHLAPLPCAKDLVLYLSEIGDHNVTWASQVSKNLQPTEGRKALNNILIPRCKLTPDGLMQLVRQMKQYGVCIAGLLSDIAVYSERIFKQHHEELKAFTVETLSCSLRFSEKEETLWPKIVK